MPRITEFQKANPGISLSLNPTAVVMDLDPGGIDVAVRYRDKRCPSEDVEPLLLTDMIVVGTPSLVAGRDISCPADLANLPWLQEFGTSEAAEWLTYHGVVPDRPLSVHQMPGNLIMDAVRRGDGITYTARAFFREDLKAGRVVELFSESAFGIFYVETRPGSSQPAVRTFVRWLSSQSETVVV